MAVKISPTINNFKYSAQWELINGMKFNADMEMRPSDNTPTIPKEYTIVDNVAANTACTINNNGATKRNVNSIGSVIPHATAVIPIGINKPNTFFFFSSFAVA